MIPADGPQSILARLQAWYLLQCDGEWEQSYGVDIGNLDNPGWTVRISLTGTPLEHRTFPRVEWGEAASDLEELREAGEWAVCVVKIDDGETIFDAVCGPASLERVLSVFLEWAGARPE